MPVSGLLGRKLGMTALFIEAGKAVPVTVLEVGPCTVVQVRTKERDGYDAVQLAFESLPPSARRGGNIPRGRGAHRARGDLNKPARGHFEKAGVEPHKHLAEFAFTDGDAVKAGIPLTVEMFKAGDRLKVRGVSKGKGFAGVIKRWHFSGQTDSHGQKIHRKPASQGSTDPARVFKASKRPGRMGNRAATVLNLSVVKVVPERNLLLVKGSVPGPNGGLLRIETQER